MRLDLKLPPEKNVLPAKTAISELGFTYYSLKYLIHGSDPRIIIFFGATMHKDCKDKYYEMITSN